MGCLVLVMAVQPAFSLDYDRNDVLGRELSLGTLVAPIDVDPRAPEACAGDASRLCNDRVTRPLGLLLRGSVRRHTRFLYVSGELQVGATMPTGGFGSRPWLGLGGSIGGETAQDGWQPLRGYGEVGLAVVYTHTSVQTLLHFFVEGGLRWQARTYARPHLLFHLGVRAMHNFTHAGYALMAGVGWTFD